MITPLYIAAFMLGFATIRAAICAYVARKKYKQIIELLSGRAGLVTVSRASQLTNEMEVAKRSGLGWAILSAASAVLYIILKVTHG